MPRFFCCCHCQRCLKKSTAGWKLHQETRPESKKLWASCDGGTWFVHIFGPKSGGEALERPLETPSIWSQKEAEANPQKPPKGEEISEAIWGKASENCKDSGAPGVEDSVFRCGNRVKLRVMGRSAKTNCFFVPSPGAKTRKHEKLLGGDWNHGMYYDFPYIGNGIIIPTDFHSIIFQRGRRKTTNQKTSAIQVTKKHPNNVTT